MPNKAYRGYESYMLFSKKSGSFSQELRNI